MSEKSQEEYVPTKTERALLDKLIEMKTSQQTGVAVMAILEGDEQRREMLDWLKENPHPKGMQMIEKAMELNPNQE